jgi:eukaryotic-like serine/threonine-protein kinase
MNSRGTNSSIFDADVTGKVVLGRYHIVRKIASGGMGVVWLARRKGAHEFLKKGVVVKIILPGYAREEQFLGMFIREAKILSSLHHPGIVEVIDFGEQDDYYVMVLEYVHGFQLREWARYRKHVGKVFSIDVVLKIIVEVLEALYHAHTLETTNDGPRRVIHRDISPSNVMLRSDGRLKLVDFGIARMSNVTGGYRTESGAFRGKLSYSAPERFGSSDLTPETDIYSVGVMLHELLTGENEFFTGDHASTIAKVLNHQVSSVLRRRPDAPPRLDRIIARALAKDWEKRYGSAMDFANDLRGMLVQSESAVKEKIAAQVAEDFTDEMAQYLGCQSLNDLERAWRHPSTLPAAAYIQGSGQENTINLSQSPPRPVASLPPITDVFRNRYKSTLPMQQNASPALSVLRGTTAETDEEGQIHITSGGQTEVVFSMRPLTIIGILLIAMASVAGIVYFFMSRHDTNPPDKFFLVQENSASSPVATSSDPEPVMLPDSPVDAVNASLTAMAVESTPDEPVAPLQSKSGIGPNKRPNKAKGTLTEDAQLMMLSKVFQKEQRAVERCLAHNESLLAGIDRIFVRFAVDAAGHVTRSSVTPARLSGTELAGCIENIAQRTRFPALNKSLSFAIPIAVTRSGN